MDRLYFTRFYHASMAYTDLLDSNFHFTCSHCIFDTLRCLLGKCKNSPAFQQTCPDDLESKEIRYSLWESRKVEVIKMNKNNGTSTKEEYIFALHPYVLLHDGIEKLRKTSCQV